MRISASLGSEVLGRPVPPAALGDDALDAESRGYPCAWCVHMSRGIDALGSLVAAGARTSTIELCVGVVPIYPRHPVALAQQAATVQSLLGGRLTLGVGVSHRPAIEGMHGLAYAKPAQYLREYLSVLRPMLRHGKAVFDGEFFHVDAEFTVPGTSPVPVLVGGLSPRMVRAAGELADGLVTWLAGPRSLGAEIVPALQAAARDAGHPPARVVAGLPVAVCDDVAAGRAAAAQMFGRYLAMPNYQRQFARDGVDGPAEVALVGDERAVEDGLRGLASAGVTEVWPVPFPVEGPSSARTAELLASLAPELS